MTLFTLKGRDDQRLQKILQLAEPFGISVQKASRDSLEKLAGLPFHQGVVAAVRPHPTLNEKDLDQLMQQSPDAFDAHLILQSLGQKYGLSPTGDVLQPPAPSQSKK